MDLETGKLLTEVKGHERDVYSLAYSTKAEILYSGSYDESIKAWKLVKDGESGEFKL